MAVVGIGVGSVAGLDRLAAPRPTGSTTSRCTIAPASSRPTRRSSRARACRASTRSPARSSGCSASSSCACRCPAHRAPTRSCCRAVTHAEAARLREALGQPAPAQPDAHVRLGRRGAAADGADLAADQRRRCRPSPASTRCFTTSSTSSATARDCSRGWIPRAAIAIAVAVVLGAAYVLSFLAAIVVFAGFEVERDAQVLRIRRGLLERRAQSIPLERVDGVVIVEGLARGPLGPGRAAPGDRRARRRAGRRRERCCRSCGAPRPRP